MKKFFTQHKAFCESWHIYWESYGGIRAVLRSPYFALAIVLSLGTYPIWLGKIEDFSWHDCSLSVLPDLLGFTLGGFAIWLAFGDDKFRRMLAGRESGEKASPFIRANATFLHFLVLQTVALLISIVGKVWQLDTGIPAFIGWTIFLYAVSTAFAAAMAIMRLSRWFDEYTASSKNSNENR
jgi:hypothetical protein